MDHDESDLPVVEASCEHDHISIPWPWGDGSSQPIVVCACDWPHLWPSQAPAEPEKEGK